MKKTISIALGGRVFQIEEDGFVILETYLNGLKAHFAVDGSVDELLSDIETSLGEKFAEKLGSPSYVVTKFDVERVIEVMGKLEELTDGDPSTPAPAEPAKKRLYRDPDDTVIAGVCSGLAAYFGLTPTTVRIAFLVLTLLNGFGILAYLILWAAVPLAETNAQKLEMRGKPMNVEEIEQLVKGKAQKMGEEGKAAVERLASKNQPLLTRLAKIPALFVNAIVQVIRAVGRIIIPLVTTLIGFALVLAAMAGFIALAIVGPMLLLSGGSATFLSEVPLGEIASQPLYAVGVISACVTAFVPLLFLVLLGVTLMRRQNQFRGATVTLLVGIWLLALGGASVAVVRYAPWLESRIAAAERAPVSQKTFAFTDFDALDVSDQVRVRVAAGPVYSVTASGSSLALERLVVSQSGKTLRFMSTSQGQRWCLFCAFRPVEVTVTLPALQRLVAQDVSYVEVAGFSSPFSLTAQDASRVTAMLSGQAVTAVVRDISHVELLGRVGDLNATVTDASRFTVEDLAAAWLQLEVRDIASATIKGKAEKADLTTHDMAQIDVARLDVKVLRTDRP